MSRAPKHLIDWKFWDDGEIREVLSLARRVKSRRRSSRAACRAAPW